MKTAYEQQVIKITAGGMTQSGRAVPAKSVYRVLGTTSHDLRQSISEMFGLPTRKDFDDVTRQLTELRREVRALARQGRAQKIEGTR